MTTSRWHPAVSLTLACAVLVGVAAGCGQPRSQPAATPAAVSTTVVAPAAGELGSGSIPSAPPDLVGPTTTVDGAPMGYRRDAAGARAAGTSFTRLNEALVQMSEPEAAAAWRAMSAQAAADQLVAEVGARLASLRQRWPRGQLSYRVAPLAVRVAEIAPDDMEVAVWYVGVVAARGLPTYEEWLTDTYRLVWERDDWRVASLVDTAGPRPAPGTQEPASPAEIEARLAGFEAVR